MKQCINVGMIGLGTVGTGALRILRENAELIRRRVGVPVDVTKIAVRDVRRDRGIAVPAGMLTTDPSLIIEDPNIDYGKLAQSMGLYAEGPVTDPKNLGPAIKRAIAAVKRGEPALIDVVTQPR